MKLFGTILICWVSIASLSANAIATKSRNAIQRRDDVAILTLTEGDVTFQLSQSPVLPRELQARYPEMRAFVGSAVGNPQLKICLEESRYGTNARVFGEGRNLVIDERPYDDAIRGHENSGEISDCFRCLTKADPTPLWIGSSIMNKPPRPTNGVHTIRTSRIAIAAAGEYTEFHGGTVEGALAAIVTVLNRINSIYERELGVRLVLVSNNDQVIFTDKNTDPFSVNSPSNTTLSEGQAVFDNVIGSANYDVGMVFNTGDYGLAYLRAVCDLQRKGSSCIGLPQPTGERFMIYAAHELAHMFGANHSFNSNAGFCSGNRNGSSAVEPGTGSTLMSYAGLPCAGDSLQPLMDDYFHALSIAEIQNFVTNSVLCGTLSTVNNNPPTVQAASDFTIPRLTPFTLQATGSDADNDVIYYSWDQMNTGPATSVTDPDNGFSPLFRSFTPTTNSSRTFPRLPNILQNAVALGEMLPNTTRSLHFRVLARDSRNVGATAWTDTHVHVVTNAGPFRILSHNTTSVPSGSQTVVWDVAGTSNSPVNTTAVNILLSTNSGMAFNIVLATNTPNDGSQIVTLPQLNTTNGRIKIEAVGNIFFDISDVNFKIVSRPSFAGIEKVSGGVLLRWTFQAGKTYKIEGTQSLAQEVWQEISITPTTTGSEMRATVPFGLFATRYFRVVEQ